MLPIGLDSLACIMAPNRSRAASHSAATPKPPADLSALNDLYLASLGPLRSQSTALTGHAPSSLSSPSLDGDVDEKAKDEEEEGEKEEDEEDDDDDADFQSQYSPDAPFSSGSSSESSESNHGDEPDPEPSQHRRPFLHHSNSSHSHLIANSFAPPFYNRPPTPLPPSPSLTSLLRPSFSATTSRPTSRPTTPDSSENDTPNDTEAAVAKSARIATTVPRASPKVPTYEYYGFVLYLLSSLVFRQWPPTLLKKGIKEKLPYW